jgi:transposase
VAGVQRRQVFEAAPAPPPVVTEYLVQARACGRCGAVTAGHVPAGVSGRVQYGPRAHAVAAALASGHHVPVARAAQLMGELTGLRVSAGWLAGVRGKAAARLDPFMSHVRGLLRQAGVLYADETPARAAAGLRYVHVACTPHLTALHTGDRTAAAIDAGAVLPGYAGTIVRDGYSGYDHLTSAAHAWCGAHNLRDLRDLYTADPHGQAWARAMADVLLAANAAATAARAAGQPRLHAAQLGQIIAGYQLAVDNGIHDNTARASKTCRDGLRLARRFAASQDMILRFATDLTVGFTSNQAERDIRPVKVAQRTSGGCWRTLQGLADFAIVQSYLSTTAKWGITTLDALTRLFTTGPWLPPATAPP